MSWKEDCEQREKEGVQEGGRKLDPGEYEAKIISCKKIEDEDSDKTDIIVEYEVESPKEFKGCHCKNVFKSEVTFHTDLLVLFTAKFGKKVSSMWDKEFRKSLAGKDVKISVNYSKPVDDPKSKMHGKSYRNVRLIEAVFYGDGEPSTKREEVDITDDE